MGVHLPFFKGGALCMGDNVESGAGEISPVAIWDWPTGRVDGSSKI